MSFSYSIGGVAAALARFNQVDAKLGNALGQGVSRGVQGGVSVVRGNASGRPGPRVITGAFRASIQADSESSGLIATGQIGTNAPQGARLEFGFVGPDRLGRVYNQPPFAYMQPSVPEVTEIVVSEVTAAVQAAF